MDRLFRPLHLGKLMELLGQCGFDCAFSSFWADQGHWICLLLFIIAAAFYWRVSRSYIPVTILGFAGLVFLLPFFVLVLIQAVNCCGGIRPTEDLVHYSWWGLMIMQYLSAVLIVVAARGHRLLAVAFAVATVVLGGRFSMGVFPLIFVYGVH